jgi:hypothetical protein
MILELFTGSDVLFYLEKFHFCDHGWRGAVRVMKCRECVIQVGRGGAGLV